MISPEPGQFAPPETTVKRGTSSDEISADLQGLTEDEVAAALAREGPNLLPSPPTPSLLNRFGRQLSNPFSALLATAAIASIFLLGEALEGLAILAILALNVVMGGLQEARADRAMASLRALAAPTATVRRSGLNRTVPAAAVVPGDLVLLEAGDRVPADVQLLSSVSLALDESLLTGESLPVEKSVDSLATRSGSTGGAGEAFAGTLVVRGRGAGRVTRTGAATAMGTIAASLAESPPTPLERELREASGRIAAAGLAVGALLVALTFLRSGRDWEAFLDGLLAGVALAVAAIPEGLLAVVTMALALGAQRMARRNAIVRHLPAIEALGSISTLCTDKTGTLTTGKLSVSGSRPLAARDQDLWAAALRCNDAVDGQGDPLDVALLQEAERLGLQAPPGRRLVEIPFDPRIRSMATVHETDTGPVLSLKGAPEVVLARCRPGEDTDALSQAVEEIAAVGQRVLAFADARSADVSASGLRPLGLVALADPLRPSARATVADCRRAGIDLVLVTGDHLATAQAIARSAGMESEPAVTGQELARMSSTERERALASARVVARVQPDIKVELVDVLRSLGRIVGMTGDGVNDAPALQRADVGVALAGARGSDVARESADIVVTDDDLATLVEAVREGRRIYRNARSVIRYLLTGNISEIVVVLVGLALFPELTVPLLPIQILWVNLVTDGLPAIALALDRAPGDPLDAPPRDVRDRLLTFDRQVQLALRGLVVGTIVLLSTLLAEWLGWEDEELRVQLLLSLVGCHLAVAYVSRSEGFSFARGWADNRLLLVAIGGSASLQAAMILLEPGRTFLSIDPLPAGGWLIAMGAAGLSVLFLDLLKLVPAGDRRQESR